DYYCAIWHRSPHALF
nr:immunoglobulin light chain junction region [Macaca mulatta]